MQVQTVETWYQTLTALDLWLVGLAALAALIVAGGAVLQRTMPGKRLNVSVPMPPIWFALAAGLALRLPRMFTDPFWYDETFTAAVARLPMNEFFTVLQSDVHPPLYYWLAKLSGSLLGWSEPALRLPSLIGGLALIYVVYQLVKSLQQPESAARLAGLLVATFPAFIHYSAEARYPMLLALAVTSAWLGIQTSRKTLFMLSAAATPLLHATAVIYAVVLVCYAFYKRRWENQTALVLGAMAGSIALIVSQSGDVADGFWLWRMVPLWHVVNGTVLTAFEPELVIVYVAVLVLMLLAVWQMWHIERDWLLLIGVLVPAAVFGVGLVWHAVYLPRALLASVVGLLIGMAAISIKRPAFLVLTLVTVGLSQIAYYDDLNDDTDLSAVFAECDGYDVTYTTSTNMAIIAQYYAPGETLTFRHGNNQHQEIDTEARQALGFDFTPPEMIHSRVCAVISQNYYTTPLERSRIEKLREYARLWGSVEIIDSSVFATYEVITWNRNKPRKEPFTRTISE